MSAVDVEAPELVAEREQRELSFMARYGVPGVYQNIFGSDINTPGNCTQAAVASMVGLPLDEVPHFVGLTVGDPRRGAWWHVLTSWSEDRFGFTWGAITLEEIRKVEWTCDPKDILLMGAGKSPRGVNHSTVVDGNLDLVWDPHPRGGGTVLFDVEVPGIIGDDGRIDIIQLPKAAR